MNILPNGHQSVLIQYPPNKGNPTGMLDWWLYLKNRVGCRVSRQPSHTTVQAVHRIRRFLTPIKPCKNEQHEKQSTSSQPFPRAHSATTSLTPTTQKCANTTYSYCPTHKPCEQQRPGNAASEPASAASSIASTPPCATCDEDAHPSEDRTSSHPQAGNNQANQQ